MAKFKVFFYEENENNKELKPFVEVEAGHAFIADGFIVICDGNHADGKMKGVFNLSYCFVIESDSFTDLKNDK